jgi:hypothetical protein
MAVVKGPSFFTGIGSTAGCAAASLFDYFLAALFVCKRIPGFPCFRKPQNISERTMIFRIRNFFRSHSRFVQPPSL